MSSATSDNEFVTPTGVLWDDPEAGKTWLVSIVGVTILAALVMAISVIYFRTEQAEVDAKVIEPEYLALKDLKASQLSLLAGSGTYTTEVGGQKVERRRIPVAEAIRMMAGNPALAVPPAGSRAGVAPAADAGTPTTPTAASAVPN
jgi:hypothetical protein